MTKERLAELIEQGVSVYTTSGYHTELKPCEYLIKENNVVTIKCECYIGLSEIYETETEAIHHAKYGNITRMEKMPVPLSYEEIGEFYMFVIYVNKKPMYLLDVSTEIQITDCLNYKILRLPRTKENYNLALDKMVQLFKGEE